MYVWKKKEKLQFSKYFEKKNSFFFKNLQKIIKGWSIKLSHNLCVWKAKKKIVYVYVCGRMVTYANQSRLSPLVCTLSQYYRICLRPNGLQLNRNFIVIVITSYMSVKEVSTTGAYRLFYHYFVVTMFDYFNLLWPWVPG